MMPNSPEIHFHLARAYSKAKQPEKAEQEREIFARLNAVAEHQRTRAGARPTGRHTSKATFRSRGRGSTRCRP